MCRQVHNTPVSRLHSPSKWWQITWRTQSHAKPGWAQTQVKTNFNIQAAHSQATTRWMMVDSILIESTNIQSRRETNRRTRCTRKIRVKHKYGISKRNTKSLVGTSVFSVLITTTWGGCNSRNRNRTIWTHSTTFTEETDRRGSTKEPLVRKMLKGYTAQMKKTSCRKERMRRT